MAQADGSVVIEANLDVSKADKELARLKSNIEKTESSIQEMEAKKSPLTQQAEELNQKLKAAQAEVQRYGQQWAAGVAGADKMQSDAISKVSQTRAEYEKIVASIDKIDARLVPAYENLDRMKDKAGQLQQKIDSAASASYRLGDAMDMAREHMSKFTDRVNGLAKRVLVFSVITMALRSLRTWLGKVIKTNDEASAAIAKLKGALLTLVQPLVNIVIPALVTLVNLLTRVISMAAQVVSKLFGTTAAQSAEAAKALYDQTEALDGVGSAASDASKSLAGFDEINQLSAGTSANAGGASAAASDAIEPDFSGTLDGKLGEIEGIVGGALLALGAILAFSGVNIPLGITLMAAGALTLAAVAKDNWDAIVLAMQGPIGKLTALLSGALLVIGGILALSGSHIGLGIGLMAAGAVGLATTVGLNWDALSDALGGPIGVITTLVSGALLALGAILTFSGTRVDIGIGLMIAGAVGLAATVTAINWDTIEETLRGPVGAVTALISIALLALGAIFTFSGAHIRLGIGLMIAGAVGLAATVALNWDTIQTALQGPIGAVVGIVSAALLVLGVILLFTGAGIPLGLGLIAVGAVGLAAAIVPNWDFLKEKLKDAWDSVKNWWDAHVAKYFTAEWWKQLGKDMLNGLLESLESGINKALSGAADFVNGIIGIINKIPGINIGPVSWGNVKLPRLATGAVIPPNREFLAVLGDQKSGTNIEAPLSTIEQAVENVLKRNGGTIGEIKLVIKAGPGLTRYLKYELDGETKRQGAQLVEGTI